MDERTALEIYLEKHPELAYEMYLLASEIVDDFDDWGGTMTPMGEDEEFDEATAIRRLKRLRDSIISASSRMRR